LGPRGPAPLLGASGAKSTHVGPDIPVKLVVTISRDIGAMRRPMPSSFALAVLATAPLALAGCNAVPSAPQHQELHRSAAFLPSAPDERACLAGLGAREASFTVVPDAYYGAGCATINTVRLFSLSGDRSPFAVSNLGPVACPLANAFAGWARFGVDRAAQQFFGSPLVRIETMGSYACRNIAGTERRSAHATANAIDVSGFDLADGRHITILGDWYAGDPTTRSFLRVVERSACRRFGTVLSPDYNTEHRNHLHVEYTGYNAPGSVCH